MKYIASQVSMMCQDVFIFNILKYVVYTDTLELFKYACYSNVCP